MITFFNRRSGLLFALVFLWGFQFVFFPSHHYHLESVHAHSGELSPRQHQDQLHSHELEALNQIINNHSPESLPTEDHHSDPLDDNHSGNYEISLHKSSLKPETFFQTVQSGDVQNNFIIAKPIYFSPVLPDALPIYTSGLPDSPKERSPPSFLI